MTRPERRSIPWLNAASITAFAILLAVALLRLQPALLEMLELRSYDLRFQWRGPREHSPAIAIARIDEHSLDTLGKWPWPRSRFAELIDALSRRGAAAIGFDAGFWEPDENSELRFVARMRESLDRLGIADARIDALLEQAHVGADHDQALADAIRRASAPVVLGYFFHMADEQEPSAGDGGAGREIDPDEAARRIDALRPAQYPLVMEEDPDHRPALTTAVAPEPHAAQLPGHRAAVRTAFVRADRPSVCWVLRRSCFDSLDLSCPAPKIRLLENLLRSATTIFGRLTADALADRL